MYNDDNSSANFGHGVRALKPLVNPKLIISVTEKGSAGSVLFLCTS